MTPAQVDDEPDATQWAFVERGSGPVVVLVHGLGTDSSAWDRIVPALAEHYRVIAVDLPGYSLKTAVDEVPEATEIADGLADLLERLGIASAVLVGHSFGGAICLMTAQRHPDRCAGLVLIAPGGFGKELNPFIPLLGTSLGSRLLGSLYGPRTSRTIERLAARVEARPARDTRLRIAELMETYDRLRTEQARLQFRTSVQQTLALSAGADRSKVADLDPEIPILVLWGREDRVLPVWQAKTAAALLPWAMVHLLDGAGHTPHRSHARETNREIVAFADSGAVRKRLSLPES